MTKRTRLFMGVALGVLVVGLGTGLVASYYGIPALAQLGGNGPAELAYVPADARLVAFANVRDVMDSDLHRRIMDLRPKGSAASSDGGPDLFKEAGINIETDIDRVVASMSTGEGTDRDRPLLLARGRFDDDLIETLVRQRGGDVEAYKGKRLLALTQDGKPGALAFVEPDLVAVGTITSVKRAIDTKDGASAGIVSNGEVMALVRDIDNGNAWAVGRFDAISSQARLPQEVASKLPPINWFAATGHVNGGVDGLIRAEARDEAAAQDLRQVIQGFLALARLQVGQNPQIRGLVNSLELGGTGKTVSLSFSLPADAIDALAALRNQQRREAPGSDRPAPRRPRTAAPALPRT